MAVELIAEPALSAMAETEPRAALTPRGVAAVHLIRFEEAWRELDGVDRAYFASELEQLARQSQAARQEGGCW